VIVLIDADTLCYASAAMAEQDPPNFACHNAENGLESLLERLNNPEYKLYVTGEGNFRHKVYPEYKANRLKVPRPQHLQIVKDFLIRKFSAIEAEGCEADDLLGVEQTANMDAGVESMISSIDKDLDQIPGWHYSPELKRKGIVVKEARKYFVTPFDGLRFFYYQMLVGDPTDNIKGVVQVGKVGAAEHLEGANTEEELYRRVAAAYDCNEEMDMNAKCLWIWRKLNDDPTERFKEFRVDTSA